MLRKSSIALVASAVALFAAIAVPASADAQLNSGMCGGMIAKSTGGYWSCTFADGFNGSALDRSKWEVMETPTSGFTHAYECYIDDPSTVAVSGGLLRLTARKLANAESCGSLFTTRYWSGMVHTAYDFSQTYGRFEARIKFPTGVGFHSSWWMWPKNMTYGNRSGEIDIAEHFGVYPDYVSPHVHLKDEDGDDRGRSAYCKVADPDGRFHNYTVEWLPLGKLTFLYDGVPCMTFADWNPGQGLTYPQPFDQPFFMILTLALGWPPNAVTESTPFPGTLAVEYVRAWR